MSWIRGGLRIGVVNVMPIAQTYEPVLAEHIGLSRSRIEWIRLESHIYKSSDRADLWARYRTYENVVSDGPLDGLIVTGAPVDGLPFESVTYWPELQTILRRAREAGTSILGICWGGLAVARQIGIASAPYAAKLFGVYSCDIVEGQHPLARELEGSFFCPHSRRAGLVEGSLGDAVANGTVHVVARSVEAGPVVVASADSSMVMHLGHPEYPTERLAQEYRRDRAGSGAAPVNYDVEAPENVWIAHGRRFFRGWLAIAAARAERRSHASTGATG